MAAFPDDPAFAAKCYGEKKTVLEAKAARSDILDAKVKTLEAQAAEDAKKPPAGATDLPSGEARPKSFTAAVQAEMKADPKLTKGKAVLLASRKNPQLHAQAIHNGEDMAALAGEFNPMAPGSRLQMLSSVNGLYTPGK
jgi:hypothetical protein